MLIDRAAIGALTALLVVGVSVAPAADPRGPAIRQLHQLSDFSGTIPYSDVLLHVDRDWDETYVTDGGTVRIFNASGMEIHRFRKEWGPGTIFGLGVEEDGDILLLLRDYTTSLDSPPWWLHRCDYRGAPIGPVEVRGLPDELASFSPDRMAHSGGTIHLVQSAALQVVVLDADGNFLRRHDLADLLKIDRPQDNDIYGFSTDREGNMLFTIPVLFTAFVVSPDETVRQFGAPGSSIGRFGIVSGIVADDHGNYIVADKLRQVVTIFDPSFVPIAEISTGGGKRLVRPTGLAVGNSGRLYVTQARNEGVSVFSLTHVPDGLAGDDNERGGEPANIVGHGGTGDPPTELANAVPRDPKARTIHPSDRVGSNELPQAQEDKE